MRKNLFAGSKPIASFFFAVGCFVAATVSARAASFAYAPVHGVITALSGAGHVQARIDAVPNMFGRESGAYTIIGPVQDPDHLRLRVGSGFSAFYALRKHEFSQVRLEPVYTAGLPDSHITGSLAVGDPVPDFHFIDQTGRPFSLAELRGKLVLLSFFYTRCPDREICPAISGRYAYMQSHLDPSTTVLVEVSLDPRWDSPANLAAYGRQFGADPASWSLATSESHTVSDALAAFGLSNLQSQPGNFIHDDILAFIDRDGKLVQTITTAGWSPDDVLASVASMNGLPSNFLARIRLAAIAQLVSACGGSTTAAVAIMDSVVFVAGVLFFGGILFWFGRKIWHDPA